MKILGNRLLVKVENKENLTIKSKHGFIVPIEENNNYLTGEIIELGNSIHEAELVDAFNNKQPITILDKENHKITSYEDNNKHYDVVFLMDV